MPAASPSASFGRPARSPGLPLLLSLTSTLLLAAAGVQAQTGPTPAGRYLTANGNLEVEIAACGSALCGTVTRVLANRSMHRGGQAMQPVDPRPPLGMRLLDGFRPTRSWTDGAEALLGAPQSAPEQWQGRLYDRETGKHHDTLMSVDAAGDLVLRAYIGLPVFGRTLVWHRLPPAAAATVPSASASAAAGVAGQSSGAGAAQAAGIPAASSAPLDPAAPPASASSRQAASLGQP